MNTPALLTARDVVIPEGPAGRRRRLLVLVICSSSLFLAYLDSTILNVALPTIGRDLHASLSALQWVADAYLLVLASILLLSGSTADRLGRKRLFLLGLTGFSLGSLLCSFAPNVGSLVALRMLQALGGSMLTPVSLSIVRNVFTDARERAQALGIWSGIFGLAVASGPVAGGILVTEVGWRSVFWVNVPIGACMIIAARRYLPESRAPRPRRVDVPGQLLMIAFLGSLTYAVIEGPSTGWVSTPILCLFAVAAGALAAFVAVERRRPEPLLELRFFRSPPFTGVSVIAVLAYTALAGFLFVATLYLQEVRDYSPLKAGLAVLPATALMAVAAPVAGQLNGRRGPRLPLVASGVLMAAGAAVLLELTATSAYALLAVAFALFGAGQGLVNPPVTNTGVSGMPPAQAGVASAVISSTRQFGNVLGVAVMGAMLAAGMAGAGSGAGALSSGAGASGAGASGAGASGAGVSGAGASGAGAAGITAHDRAFAAATHGPWWLAVACGVLIAVVGWFTTSPRALEIARNVAGAD